MKHKVLLVRVKGGLHGFEVRTFIFFVVVTFGRASLISWQPSIKCAWRKTTGLCSTPGSVKEVIL